MGGAGRIVAEAGAVNFFFENTTANGTFNLSPLGEVALGFSHFAHAAGTASEALEDWRGIAYVPIALLVEVAHGMGERSVVQRRASRFCGLFDCFFVRRIMQASGTFIPAMHGTSFR